MTVRVTETFGFEDVIELGNAKRSECRSIIDLGLRVEGNLGFKLNGGSGNQTLPRKMAAGWLHDRLSPADPKPKPQTLNP